VEKLLTVTDKSALGPGAGRGQFLGEAESNIRFEHMFDSALTQGSRAHAQTHSYLPLVSRALYA
jgi:hypothetical protein